MEIDPKVVEISAAAAKPIRRTVLRRGTPTDHVDFPGDDDPPTVHLGVRVNGELVAVSTWLHDERDKQLRVQLRGMATIDAYQGHGLGALLIDEGVRRAKESGAVEVWANARDSALRFYRRQGFEVVGDGFLTADTKLSHHVVRLPL